MNKLIYTCLFLIGLIVGIADISTVMTNQVDGFYLFIRDGAVILLLWTLVFDTFTWWWVKGDASSEFLPKSYRFWQILSSLFFILAFCLGQAFTDKLYGFAGVLAILFLFYRANKRGFSIWKKS